MPSKDIDKDLRQVAESLVLADMMFRKGKVTEAEPMYERALAMLFRSYAEAHPDVDACLLRLSDIYFSREKYAQALSSYSRLYGLRCRTRGLHHEDTQAIAFKVAKAQEKLEQFEDAGITYQTAIAQGLQWTGPAHPLIGSMMESYALLLRRNLNDPQRAAEIEKKAKEYRARTKATLPLLKSRLPESLLAAYPDPVEQPVDLTPNTVRARDQLPAPNSVRARDQLPAPNSVLRSEPVAPSNQNLQTQNPVQQPQVAAQQPPNQTVLNKPGFAEQNTDSESIKLAHPADPKTTQHRFIGSALQKFAQQYEDIAHVSNANIEPQSPSGQSSEVRKFLQPSESPEVDARQSVPAPLYQDDSSKTQFSGRSYDPSEASSRGKPYVVQSNFEQQYDDSQYDLPSENEAYNDQHDRARMDDEEYYADEFEEERPRSRSFLMIAFVVLIVLVVPIFIGWTMMGNQSKQQAYQPSQHTTFGGTTMPLESH